MNKNGFIATSLIYSFFLIFCALLVCYVGIYMHNKLLLDNITTGIKAELESDTKDLKDAPIGSYVKLTLKVANDEKILNNINDPNRWIKIANASDDTGNFVGVLLISDTILYSTSRLDSAIDDSDSGILFRIQAEDTASYKIDEKRITTYDDLNNFCNNTPGYSNLSDIVIKSVFTGSILKKSGDISDDIFNYLIYNNHYYIYQIPTVNQLSAYCDALKAENLLGPLEDPENIVDLGSSFISQDNYNVRVVIKIGAKSESYLPILTGNGTLLNPYILK